MAGPLSSQDSYNWVGRLPSVSSVSCRKGAVLTAPFRLSSEQSCVSKPRLLHFRLHRGTGLQQLAGGPYVRQALLQPGPLLVIVAGAQGLTEPGGLGVAIEEEGLHLLVRVDEETTSIRPRVGEAPDPVV